MANIASEPRLAALESDRPTAIAALVLSIAAAATLEWDPELQPTVLRMSPPVIVPMELAPPHVGALGDVLRPDEHPDARPWPHGMVIGSVADSMTREAHPDAQPWPHGMLIQPPPTAETIQLALPTALDRLLSALLAPWLSSAS